MDAVATICAYTGRQTGSHTAIAQDKLALSRTAITPDQFATFGDLLKYLRRRAGLTQRELSIAVGYSDTQISRLEQNQRVPDAATLAAFFVPALDIADQPEWAARLLHLAEEARHDTVQPPPDDRPSMPAHPNNLPLQLTSFVGREKEIGRVQHLLSQTRLLTLTGSGGTGKTRLSLQVAAEMLPFYPDGAWFIELAPLADPSLVPQTTAAALGVRGGERPVLETLIESLRDKNILLILDNCEHLIDACASLAETLLGTCSGLRILASSREALGIPGESSFQVPPLSLPADDQPASHESLNGYESVRLFVERATTVLPDFAFTDRNAPVIAEVCRRLDGIPLAIELAAARVGVLRVEQIAARLSDRFHLLTSGSRTALPHLQTLKTAMDWSYDLLQNDEQTLLMRLSVFAGGWSLEAAETICGWGGLEGRRILDLLTRLVNKSLVVAERRSGAEARYHLLETIREYAWEKLSEMGAIQPARDRHLDYFVHLAEEAEPELLTSNQLVWLRRLDTEFDNIRAALGWSHESSSSAQAEDYAEMGLRLGSAIWRFALRYGYADELISKLSNLLAQPGASLHTSARARALSALSTLCVWHAELVRAGALAEEALHIYRELGDLQGVAYGLYLLGTVAIYQNLAWEPLFQESLALSRSHADSAQISQVLVLFGSHLQITEPDRAQAYLEEALDLSRERGDVITMAGALDSLGLLALHQGNFSQARSWLEESLAIQRPLGRSGYLATVSILAALERYEGNYSQARAYEDEVFLVSKNAGIINTYLWTLVSRGYTALHEDQREEAQTSFEEALRGFAASGQLEGMMSSVEGLAALSAWYSQPERAARLFSWVEAGRKANNLPLSPTEQSEIDRTLAVVRVQLDAAAYESAFAEGRAISLEQAIAYALEAE